MDLFKNIGETVNNTVDFLVEKNRKFTKMTKIKRLIKKETDSIIRAYITLGKHYYAELRDVPDKEMQELCESVDFSKNEIKKLKKKLTEIDNEENCSNFRDLLDDDILCDECDYTDDTLNIGNCTCNNNPGVNGKCECPENVSSKNDGTCHCNEDKSSGRSGNNKKNKK